ncbi:MAG: hypothetical protein HOP03_15315 [Lysobacter sp.]|nr:hypothetical protein [Lysobacter sp.]
MVESTVSEELKFGGAMWIVLFGLVVIGCLAFFLTGNGAWEPADITALIGSLTTFLGTVVGAFLGVQVGATGKANAENVARRALAALPPESARQVLGD